MNESDMSCGIAEGWIKILKQKLAYMYGAVAELIGG